VLLISVTVWVPADSVKTGAMHINPIMDNIAKYFTNDILLMIATPDGTIHPICTI
jgi:hypothetical protein